MRKPFSLFCLVLAAYLMILGGIGCTENQMAKQFGGNMTVNLPKGEKLTVATWKDTQLWYLTRPMQEGEQPETSIFRENSAFGIIEGSVIFVESAR